MDRNHYRDYRTLLRHAGLPEDEVERIASQAEQDDTMREDDLDAHDQQLTWERGIEKNINLIARQTGVDLETSHAILIEDKACTVTLYEGEVALSHLLSFANKIAAAGIGSDVKVGANSTNNVVLTFTLV